MANCEVLIFCFVSSVCVRPAKRGASINLTFVNSFKSGLFSYIAFKEFDVINRRSAECTVPDSLSLIFFFTSGLAIASMVATWITAERCSFSSFVILA